MFCYACGTELAQAPPTRCVSCGVPHYGSAAPCASCFVTRGREILLIKRGTDPFKGYWDAPSGFCDGAEHPIAAAERETQEETGLEVRATRFLGIWLGRFDVADDPEPAKDLMNVVYIAEPVGGSLMATAEAPEARWFADDELPWDRLHPEKRGAFEAWQGSLVKEEPLPDRPAES